MGLGTKNHCAGEDQQQFNSHSDRVERPNCTWRNLSKGGVTSNSQTPPLSSKRILRYKTRNSHGKNTNMVMGPERTRNED
jgi:hypothetical protein